MDIERNRLKTTSGIISADMTKIIAADSCLPHVDGSHSLTHGRTDPEADQCFEALCSALTNDTLIYFQKPPVFPEEPRPIMAAWSKVAQDLVEAGEVAKAQEQQEATGHSVEQRCKDAIGSFVGYISSGETSSRCYHWARFQFSDAELMSNFWRNTKEEEPETALHTMLARCGSIPTTLQTAFASLPIEIDRVSRLYLTKPVWTPENYTAAYIFWAFTKGYRYAASLTSEHIYAVHWLREHAMTRNDELKRRDEEYLRMLFPWGHFLRELMHLEIVKGDKASIVGAIENLRDYTKKNLRLATDFKKLEGFAREGLEQCLPKELGVADYYGGVIKNARLLLLLLALMGVGGSCPDTMNALTVVECFDLAVPARVKGGVNSISRHLRLWPYRCTIASLVNQHRPLLREHLTYLA